MQQSNDTPDALTAAAEALMKRFGPMVESQGGKMSLLGADDDTIRIGYTPTETSSCDSDACILPHLELQDMLGEVLARRSPDLKVRVSLISAD